MVTHFYGEASSSRNGSARVFPVCGPVPDPVRPETALPRPSDTRRILLGALAGGTAVALGDLVNLLPDHPRPISAIFDLVDAGDAVIDLDAAFGASSRVWAAAPN
ncbi:hypothetical protein ASF22_20175 [Methylobacterium sp. Leaf87]|uniref:hypothetical protein n=1 Tax=Methylobacterium sp. Leaf87 TaxID=1736243 RepID=UPI0006F798ED|nr:hypothetical protein [Methylobacterium sp. Leaf87]KQO67594.1 hypothetical protein ASF22_20175 [Methylobacterium sp. Leaf87]